ncbi:MAG: PP2C family protein-serine/threonine phosphatase [Lachnospiraceae bacterium]|nr:PP2C family protein-serine/threonine phosphatase [Lachnospiraceae bacterium]
MKKSFGIKGKVALITTASMLVLTVVIAWVGYTQFNRNVLESYVKYATLVTESANHVFERFNMGDILVKGEMDAAYDEARLELNAIKNHADIKYLYAVYFEDLDDPSSLCYVINGKSDEELNTGQPLAEIYSFMGEACEEDAFDEETVEGFRSCLRDRGSTVRYKEEETVEYGHTVICYRAVFDSAGNAVAVVGADIDVNRINEDLATYLRTIILIALLVMLCAIAFVLYFLQHYVTGPVTRISKSADGFVALMRREAAPEELAFEKVSVSSKDEVRRLCEDVASMAEGVRRYMMNLQSVTAEKERIGAELNVATQIQADMLPRIFPAFPDRNDFDVYATMTPAKEVGGDFYDFFLVDDTHLALVMADVSGKGVPAALFMVIAKTLIKNRAMNGGSPAEILYDVNNQLCEGNEAMLFVTVWLAIIDLVTGKGMASNAGHEHPAIRRKGGRFELVEYDHDPPLATMEEMPFEEHAFELHPGDELYVYTDGLPEAINREEELFGPERLTDALNAAKGKTGMELLVSVKDAIDTFADGAEQFDDITMMVMSYSGK